MLPLLWVHIVLGVQFNRYHEIALIVAFEMPENSFSNYGTKFACSPLGVPMRLSSSSVTLSLYRREHSREINFTPLLRDALETEVSHDFASGKDNVSCRPFLHSKNLLALLCKKACSMLQITR